MRGLKISLLGAAAALMISGAAQAETVLRVVPQADLRVIDPHVTTATVSRIYGLMVYDSLFSTDENMRALPQMVRAWTVSDDKLTYDFTLRDGLAFHDGRPVTSADVAASIPRAAKQDPMLQLMLRKLARIEPVAPDRFRLVFNEPFPYVEDALATPGAMILRAEDIAAAGDKPITTAIGSGPFRFDHDRLVSGARVVFNRNADYVSRPEPPNGNAGGKPVLVDRVEWQIIPDLQTRISALLKGEVDLLDQVPHDGVAQLRGKPGITVEPSSQFGSLAFLRVNTLQPPFNDVRARRAMAMLIQQTDFMSAAFTTDNTLWRTCFSWFGCGTPNETTAGSEPFQQPNVAEAKRLLAEAGYRGEPVVVLTSQEIPLIDGLAQVAAASLRSAGVNVDLQMSDWGTLVVRRSRKNPATEGGWSVFTSGGAVANMAQPATNILVDMRCDQNNYAGWPCSEAVEALRADLIENPTREKYEAFSRALWEEMPSLLLGQYLQLVAYRQNVSGLPRGVYLSFFGVTKTGE